MSEELSNENLKNSEWGFEAKQNWLGFCDLIFKEYIRQNPEEYKQLKNENIRSTNNANKTLTRTKKSFSSL